MGLPEKIRFHSFLSEYPMHMSIIGPRGVGKTTMLVSSIARMKKEGKDILYVYASDLEGMFDIVEGVFMHG